MVVSKLKMVLGFLFNFFGSLLLGNIFINDTNYKNEGSC